MDITLYNFFIAGGVITMQISFAIILFATIAKLSWTKWIGKNATWLLLILFATSLIGSYIYEYVFLFEPCMLCWYQRMFMIPTVVLLARSLIIKKNNLGEILTLTSVGTLIALLHNFIDLFPDSGVTVCTSGQISCSLRYVWEFGYITIPMMSLTVFVLSLVIGYLGWKEKSNPQP